MKITINKNLKKLVAAALLVVPFAVVSCDKKDGEGKDGKKMTASIESVQYKHGSEWKSDKLPNNTTGEFEYRVEVKATRPKGKETEPIIDKSAECKIEAAKDANLAKASLAPNGTKVGDKYYAAGKATFATGKKSGEVTVAITDLKAKKDAKDADKKVTKKIKLELATAAAPAQ